MLFEAVKRKRVVPRLFVEVEEHFLLENIGTIRDRNRVVVAIEAVNERLHRRLLNVAEIRRCDARLRVGSQRCHVDRTKCVDYNLKIGAEQTPKVSQNANSRLTLPLTD